MPPNVSKSLRKKTKFSLDDERLSDNIFHMNNNGIKNAKITNIKISGVDRRDYPDFVDAYVYDCDINGRLATAEELEFINSEMPWIAQREALEMYNS